MSIKLLNNNYEIIATSFPDHVHIKISNLLTYSTYEYQLNSNDISNERIRNVEDIWYIFVKAFLLIDEYKVNILDPQIGNIGKNYVVLKLFEYSEHINLTIYYNIEFGFEFNVTLKKINCKYSIYNLLDKIKYCLECKEKQIDESQDKTEIITSLLDKIKIDLENQDYQIDKLHDELNLVKILLNEAKMGIKWRDIQINELQTKINTFSTFYNKSIIKY